MIVDLRSKHFLNPRDGLIIPLTGDIFHTNNFRYEILPERYKLHYLILQQNINNFKLHFKQTHKEIVHKLKSCISTSFAESTLDTATIESTVLATKGDNDT